MMRAHTLGSRPRRTVIRALLAAAGIGSLVAPSGCRSPHSSDRLALTGGLTGAGVGAAIGEANGNAAAGAAIGSAIGAVTGAVVGDEIDRTEARNQAMFQEHLGRQIAGATSHEDIIAMSQAGLTPDVIISHIQRHGVTHPPSAQELIRLKQSGVGDPVLRAMQEIPLQRVPPPASGPVVVEEHYWVAPPYRHRHVHRRRRPGVSWGVSFSN